MKISDIHPEVYAIGAQVVAGNIYIHILRHASSLLYDSGNDANGSSASLVGGLRHTFHQSTIHAAIDDGVAFTGSPFP